MKNKALIYLVTMFLGDIIVKYLLIVIIAHMIIWKPWFQSLIASVMTVSLMLFLGIVIEGIRSFVRKKPTKIPTKKAGPFWFEVIESAFAFWILYSIAMFIATFYNYRFRY